MYDISKISFFFRTWKSNFFQDPDLIFVTVQENSPVEWKVLGQNSVYYPCVLCQSDAKAPSVSQNYEMLHKQTLFLLFRQEFEHINRLDHGCPFRIH